MYKLTPENLVHGNVVNYSGRHYIIHSYNIMEGKYHYNLLKSSFDSKCSRHNVPLEDLEPVELTNEIIEKSGFELDPNANLSVLYGSSPQYHNGILSLMESKTSGYTIGLGKNIIFWLDRDLMYYHELQNAYYFLTNKHLPYFMDDIKVA